MSAFTTKLNVQYVDGKHWILLSPFIYRVGSADSNEVVFVHAGFKTDFASIPHWAWPVLGHPTGKHGKAAVIHDYLYQYPADGVLPVSVKGVDKEPWPVDGAKTVWWASLRVPRSRRRCDQIFLEGMKVLGVSWWKRTVMYSAVRVGGRGPWRRYREAE